VEGTGLAALGVSPLMRVPAYGPLDAEICIIGQSPGRDEARIGRPFVGPAGKLFRRWLSEAGIDPESCYWTNVTDEVLLGSEVPKTAQVREGTERLHGEIGRLANLKAIVLVGSFAAHLAFEGNMSRMHGQTGELWGIPCIAVYHPSYYLRSREKRRRQAIESAVIHALARARTLGVPVVLPEFTIFDRLEVKGLVGLDTETNTEDPRWNTLRYVTLWDGRHDRGAISRNVPAFGPDAEPIVHNTPFDQCTLRTWDQAWHDTKMLAHLLCEPDTEMKSLALKHLGRLMVSYMEAERSQDEQRFMAYAVQDAKAHFDLFHALYAKLPPHTRELYDTIERPMLRLWSRMSLDGVFEIDRPGLEAELERIENEATIMKAALEKELGIQNVNSAAQVAKAFGLSGANAAQLAALQNPVADGILNYRKLRKVASTYIKPWLSWPQERLSTYWRPCGTVTGRVASARLNLQNFPPRLRPYLLFNGWEADFSQLELRVAAHISQDPNMLEAFHRGDSIHKWAQEKLGISDYRFAKIGVLATLYLGDRNAIVQQAARFGISAAEIKPHIDELQAAMRRLFAGFYRWAEDMQGRTRIRGMFGREITIPALGDPMHEWREAVNAPCQGGGADIVKISMLELEAAGMPPRHMIHDSVFVADDGKVTEMDIQEVMENAVHLSVPLKVEVKRWNA